LHAALELGRAGAQVLLIDDQATLGGHQRYRKNPSVQLVDLIASLQAQASVKVMQGCSCFGLYEGNLLGVLQPSPHSMAVERLVHVRVQRIVVATGRYETPLVFPNNDLVGVVLSSAVERLIRLHGIVPGRRAVIVAGGGRGQEVADDLREMGVAIVATVAPEAVVEAVGGRCVKGLRTREGNFKCDLVVMCGHLVPDVGLLTQAGARLDWDSTRGAFVPVDLPPHVQAVGEVTGKSLVATAPLAPPSFNKRAFICLCADVTSQDLRDAIREGFDHIETLKRYTTATMGPCQGKICQLNAIRICARETQRSMAATGLTTARPPNPSVTLGALAGARHHPIRRTPLHDCHGELGAVWMDMGDWKRPRYYEIPVPSTERRCVEEEYRAVRERAGLIDVGTLGKLDVQGRDCGAFLDWIYSNRLSDLRPGRVRYSVLCDEAGIMLDDGTISRLADDQYFVTTTTGNLDFVQQWLEWWLIGTGWNVHITNLTGLAAVNLAGPQARLVLSKLTDCDFSSRAFPYMSCRQEEVAGVPVLLLRIGFVGETGWEMHFPGEWGEYLWKKLLEAGKEFDIRPFGVEAQRLLRLEKRHVIVGLDTDALTNPLEAGMSWVAKMDKPDFIGKAALARLRTREPQQKLVGFVMQGNTVPEDGAAIVVHGKLAGRVTSVRYSPANHKAVGLAWVSAEAEKAEDDIQVRVNGQLEAARITNEAFYDPEGVRLRM
jgi:sarcosine oxidase subunit alpha